MPLDPTTLTNKLLALDEGPVQLTDIPSTAKAWADAWWGYASGMIYLNPASLLASQQLATSAFMGVIMSGLGPDPFPGAPATFIAALEGAMRAGWGALSTPASLIPPVISLIPSPVPFIPLGMTIVPVGMAAQDKTAVRAMLAGIIHGWTITHITVSSIVPPGTLGPIL